MKIRSGFTIIELMIAMAVLLVVVAYLTEMLTRQGRAYTVVDQVTEAQQNLRAIADLMERELRVTGFMVPEGAAVCGVDQTNGPDVLYVTDADALDPTNERILGIGATIQGGFNGTGGNENLALDDKVIDGQKFYDTDGDGAADSDFLESVNPFRTGGVIVADRLDPTRGASCGIVNNVNAASNTIRVDFTSNGAAPAGTPLGGVGTSQLRAVPAHVYTVANNQLLRDGMVLANDVEDLQFAFFYDVDGDGQEAALDAEYPGSEDGPVYQSRNWDNSDLREIRVSIVVRTRAQDPDVLQNPAMAQGQWQTIENRAAPAGFDGFRRRVHTSTVRPRNVGARPPDPSY
jgi:prepilin-type N-terminal cleavage/methylation domain-containing protein